MNLYTEEEVNRMIWFAMSYQKATDYQTAGHHLIVENLTNETIETLLNELANSDINASDELNIKYIQESISDMSEIELNLMEDSIYSPYCPICTACGEDGCCSALCCKQDPRGHYCGSYLTILKNAYRTRENFYNFIYDDQIYFQEYIDLFSAVDNEADFYNDLIKDKDSKYKYIDVIAKDISDLYLQGLVKNHNDPVAEKITSRALIAYFYTQETGFTPERNFGYEISVVPGVIIIIIACKGKYVEIIIKENQYDVRYSVDENNGKEVHAYVENIYLADIKIIVNKMKS